MKQEAKRVRAVKVGRKRYCVRYAHLKSEYGRMVPGKARITIDRQQTNPELADTLMHEILHAIWAHGSLPNRVSEERAVSYIAAGLVAVARDNPGLFPHIETLVRAET